MKSIEITGKSVDAAVFNGLQQLGVSIDEVKIETLQTESKGILGIGAKPAKVRLTLKAPEEIIIPDFNEERKKAHGERGDGRKRTDRNVSYGDKRAERRGGDHSVSKRAEDAKSFAGAGIVNEKLKADSAVENIQQFHAAEPVNTEAELISEVKGLSSEKTISERCESDRESDHKSASNTDVESFKPTNKVDYTEEAALNNPAADFVRGLIARMGVKAKILAFTDEKNIKLRIDSKYMGVLIGRRGETLDAIQYLTSLVVNKNRKINGYKRILVNTNDYREKREATLIRLAKKVGEQVRATGRPRTMEPMSSYERRILHSALQSNPYVATHSEGEEPNRRVIITPVMQR